MVVLHVMLLAAGGFVHAFKFSILLWPFNLVLPLLRHLPRVCVTLQRTAAHYEAGLQACLDGRRTTVPLPQLEQQYSATHAVQRRQGPQLGAPALLALVPISY